MQLGSFVKKDCNFLYPELTHKQFPELEKSDLMWPAKHKGQYFFRLMAP
jgi:hypothetical protein